MTDVDEKPNDVLNMDERVAALAATSAIVQSYVSSRNPDADGLVDITQRILEVFAGKPQETSVMKAEPAVTIKSSVKDDQIFCLHCGKGFKSLKRHLFAYHGQEPEEYRAHFNLPSTYPMVASEYSERRSGLAKKMGLGRKA